jgi:SAM-dependent methyltransferase
MKLVMDLRPVSVLDVGCGAGKWGALCREYLDWWGPGATGRRRTRIDAVEIHAPYIGALHRAVYDTVWHDDAAHLLEGCAPVEHRVFPLERYDLILAVDVIEHFERARGLRFVELAMRRCRTLLISTPMAPSPQGPAFGNEHERHVSRWKPADFEPFGAVSAIGLGGFWVVGVTARH